MKQKTKAIFFRIGKDGERFFKNRTELERAGIEVILKGHVLDEHHLPTESESDAEILGSYVDSKLSEPVLKKFKNVKMIATFSTGTDHIDLAYCKKNNIVVSYVPAYGERTVAEYAFALILALAKKICEAKEKVSEPGIRRSEIIKGLDLEGKTLGVIGTGKIGKNVIRMANGFAMKILAHDVFEDKAFQKETGFEYVELDTLLTKSDFVTLHVPAMKETNHMINKKNIGLMKETAYIINTSRGNVIESEALYAALKNKKIAGAGLDVLEEEATAFRNDMSVLRDNKKENEEKKLRNVVITEEMLKLPNVIVTPHNASNTHEAHNRIFETSAKNVVSYLQGKPENPVPFN